MNEETLKGIIRYNKGAEKEIKRQREEVERLNNIINELEKWLNNNKNPLIHYDYESKYEYIYVDELLEKLEELKEGK